MTDNFKVQPGSAAGVRPMADGKDKAGSGFKVGIDIGSTTIRVVVLDAEENLVYKKYAWHFSDIPTALVTNLTALQDVVGPSRFRFALTGSAGMGIAQRLQLPFVQEVIAAATAVKKLIPQTDTMVELGGEDAKIMYFGSAPEERMNGVCAGGTGAFIDHMAALLNTIFFMTALVVLFKDSTYMQEKMAGLSPLAYILAYIGAQAVVEMVTSTILTGAIGIALGKAKLIDA